MKWIIYFVAKIFNPKTRPLLMKLTGRIDWPIDATGRKEWLWICGKSSIFKKKDYPTLANSFCIEKFFEEIVFFEKKIIL